jgi:hypothetical protein
VNIRQEFDVFVIRANIIEIHFVSTEIAQSCFRFFGSTKTNIFRILILMVVTVQLLLLFAHSDQCIEGRHRASMPIDVGIFHPFVRRLKEKVSCTIRDV